MPPSTATYVRTPGIDLIAPTVYSTTPALRDGDETPESKLHVHPAGTDGLVGGWLDPRRETQQNVSRRVQPGGQRLEQIELMVIVDHKASNASTQRILNFIRRLVVSMEVEVLGRHAGAERGVQLST